MNVETNVSKTFLKLFQHHLPKQHPMHKISNRNTVKISYCCMRYIASVKLPKNIQVLNLSKEHFGYNCWVKDECSLASKCFTSNTMYEANVSNETNSKCKRYLKQHSKKDSRTIPETSNIKSMRSALNSQHIFGI